MATKSKKDPSLDNRINLAEHVTAFLKGGGEVKQIASGISGQTTTTGPRQIVLSHKSNT
jgi:hypothetical protein